MIISYYNRLTRGHLDSALSHSFQRSGSEILSKEYEDFFLGSADDITELLKKSQRTGSTTHLQAQQMVCDMVQVSNSVESTHGLV